MSTLKVLIVDDNHDLADGLAILLSEHSYQPTVVYTGEDAVARVLMEPYDLAIIDVKLPRMNGAEVFRAIRQLRPGIMGIMMTGFRVEKLINEAMQDGAICTLHKPFPINELLHKIDEIEQILPGHHQRQAFKSMSA